MFQCFGTLDATKFQNTSASEEWRAWNFQVRTEWGYFLVSYTRAATRAQFKTKHPFCILRRTRHPVSLELSHP